MEAVVEFWNQYSIVIITVGIPLLTYLVGLGGSMVRIYNLALNALDACKDNLWSKEEKARLVDDIVAVAKGLFWNKSKVVS